jgi:ABC-type transport system involved in cytochrome bd biosynthesis fused ATPase/permease subunit
MTEEKIMNEIYGLYQDKMLIVIAYRSSPTTMCDKMYNFEKFGKKKADYIPQ